MNAQLQQFDPIKYKQTTLQQWNTAAEAWHRWAPLLSRWLGPATETMLDMCEVTRGSRVLDVAVEAGYSVLFLTLETLMTRLSKADSENRLEQTLKQLTYPKLLIIDELGYLPLTRFEASLFFRLIVRRGLPTRNGSPKT